ncbi:MarR family winged helix-turn-helix transcriptional regulator [Mycobacterium decipiens]|nr:MarR family transcriptional regulator [Mycobacterium decipiens]
MAGDHELDAPPWRRVDGTLMATARGVRKAYDHVLADVGLTLPEASLLAYLDEIEPQSQTQLARRLGSGRAVMGDRIDTLEARGAVSRQPDPNDRRVWLVHITDTGQQLVATINELDRVLREQLRAGLSREDRHRLAAILIQIQQNLVAIAAANGTDMEDQ